LFQAQKSYRTQRDSPCRAERDQSIAAGLAMLVALPEALNSRKISRVVLYPRDIEWGSMPRHPVNLSEASMPRSDGTSALRSTAILVLALALGLAGGIGGAFATSALTGATVKEPTGAHGTDGAPGRPGE